MSHTIKVPVQLKNEELPTLLKAFTSLGWTIAENAKAHIYGNVLGLEVYPYVAINPKGYIDVGIKPGTEGLIGFYTDFWDTTVRDALGENFGKLKQAHAAQLIEEMYSNQGWTVNRTVDEKTGDLLLNVEYYG